MEIILWGIALWLGYKLFRWWRRAAHNDAYFQGYVANLTLEKATEELRAARLLLRASAVVPGYAPDKEVEETLQKAVWLQDRINSLNGEQTGPAFRAGFRIELARQINKMRTDAHERIQSMPPSDGRPVREEDLSPELRKLKRLLDERQKNAATDPPAKSLREHHVEALLQVAIDCPECGSTRQAIYVDTGERADFDDDDDEFDLYLALGQWLKCPDCGARWPVGFQSLSKEERAKRWANGLRQAWKKATTPGVGR